MRRFFVADLTVRGDVRAMTEYGYEQLEQVPGAAELITHLAANLYREPAGFETVLPLSRQGLAFRWRPTADSAGIATLWRQGELTSLGLLAAGRDVEADRLTLEAFQRHLLRELHGTPYEASFALNEIAPRPLVAVVPFLEPTEAVDQLLAALADRCFAAAYFRYHGLA